MKSLRKLLISSIALIVIGFFGFTTIFILSVSGSRLTGYSTSSVYFFGREGLCNIGRVDTLLQEDKNLSFDTVKDKAQNYIGKYSQNLTISEIMEFSKNYYIEVIEKDTTIGAMELLVNKSTGSIFPEYGPNMMWNLKYGMHSRMRLNNNSTEMPIDEEKAIDIAKSYLTKLDTNEYADDEAERFYGYYTIHTVNKDGNIIGMLSVNGFSGDIWYHSWHGKFIGMQEYN